MCCSPTGSAPVPEPSASSRRELPSTSRGQDWPRFAALLERLLDLSAEAAGRELERLSPADAALRDRLAVALAAAREESGPLDRPAAEIWAPLLLD